MEKVTMTLEQFWAGAPNAAFAHVDKNGRVYGYATWFTGSFVCLTCGMLCDCYEEEEE